MSRILEQFDRLLIDEAHPRRADVAIKLFDIGVVKPLSLLELAGNGVQSISSNVKLAAGLGIAVVSGFNEKDMFEEKGL